MNINERDLIKLRKEIERIRKHEESRQPGKADEKQEPSAAAPARVEIMARKPSPPIAARLRQMLERLLAPPEPSKESLEAIPEHVVTLLRVVREVPKFEQWLLRIAKLPLARRNEQLSKMSFAFRIEDGSSTIAESFDRLQDSALFTAFWQILLDDKQTVA